MSNGGEESGWKRTSEGLDKALLVPDPSQTQGLRGNLHLMVYCQTLSFNPPGDTPSLTQTHTDPGYLASCTNKPSTGTTQMLVAASAGPQHTSIGLQLKTLL